ncbi:amidohydrolase family protein [Mycolicibacterium mengxianglii]|uniref:amidohydrolase family protein n=1 Tax=Mycolicibacterium mengxianglii TaxID=2736649 RepID=UPI0018EEE041|nr:amidohydrolase family protein [Mycolicibacterium mengxianglii]
MLIRRASVLSDGAVDIRVGERITEIAPTLRPKTGEQVFDAAGGLVVPGLHDHHMHVRSAAAAAESVAVGPPQVRSRTGLAQALAAAAPQDGWIRAVGYHEAVAGPLDRRQLDALVPVVPLRIQHRSGALWILNSAGLALVGLPDHPDGRLLRTEVSPVLPRHPPPLRGLSDALLTHGVTGATDATPGQTQADIEALGAARHSGDFAPRLHCLAPPGIGPVRGVTLGPTKRILDDGTLDLHALEHWIAHCHGAGRGVAVHCVTTGQLVVTLAALRSAGTHPDDRIEHAAVVPADCLDDLADLGVTVVTQPNFVAERGDEYLTDVPADEHDQLWRVRSLRRAGVRLALSTDAPFGSADPWAAMRAAVHRRTPGGAVLGADERVTPLEALLGFLGAPDSPGTPRRLAVGERGDLCVLAAPAAEVLAELSSDLVAATVIDGKLWWQRGD